MFAQINHMAMNSHNWPMMAKFYEAVFGLRPPARPRPANGLSLGDGYVGLNINPLRDGYVGGLDHFGMVVDEADAVLKRMQKKFAGANIVKRPSTRPFAAYSGHDPDGNVFDLAEKQQVQALRDLRRPDRRGQAAARALSEQVRAAHAERGEVRRVLRRGVRAEASQQEDAAPGYHLTDGRVTLSILPWSIPLYEGMAIKRPGADHIGFKVESLAAFKEHVQTIAGSNPYLAPMPLGGSKESDVRKSFFAKSAGGKMQMADPGGVWIDITDE